MIDLNQYETSTNEIIPILNANRNHSLHPYLNHEIQQIQNLIHNLKPRHVKRSLNFIGSAWKWIAGNPDHEDFVTIKEKINNVLKNNNKQVIINNLYNERINNITKISNEIIKLLKENEAYNNEILTNVQYKIKLFKEELENIIYAIHWAKLGIINSLVLSKQEMNLAISTMSEEKLPFNTVEEALNFSEVKIISNSISILYIINNPITEPKNVQQIAFKISKQKQCSYRFII